MSEVNFVTGVVLRLVCVEYSGLILRKECFLLVRMLKKVLFIPGFSKIARSDSI